MTIAPTALASIALAVALALAPGAFAQKSTQPPPDALTDPAMKGKEVIAFIGLKPGDNVADIVAGRFVRAPQPGRGTDGQSLRL